MKAETKLVELSEERELRARIEKEFDRLFGTAKDPVRERIMRVLEIEAELAERKSLFAELDLLLLGLAKDGFSVLDLTGERIELVDRYASANTAWTATAIRRFEIKVESHEKREKREARKGRAE